MHTHKGGLVVGKKHSKLRDSSHQRQGNRAVVKKM